MALSFDVGLYGHFPLVSVMHDEMRRLGLSEPPNAFLRSCPVGVKSCFGAFGYYDNSDDDPDNDLSEFTQPLTRPFDMP